MATARRLTAAEAIRSLQVDEFDNSCDEDEDTTAQSVMQATLENSDFVGLWQQWTQFMKILMRHNLQSIDGTLFQVERAFHGNESAVTVNRGRAAAENIFSQRSGPTSYSRIGVQSKSPVSAFRLFIDEPMLCSIQKYTIKHGQADDKNLSVELFRIGKIYWSSNSTWCFDGKKHSNSSTME